MISRIIDQLVIKMTRTSKRYTFLSTCSCEKIQLSMMHLSRYQPPFLKQDLNLSMIAFKAKD